MTKPSINQEVLDNLKIASLNEMQLKMEQACKGESDVVLLSPTGSGKTLGFLLPILQRLDAEKSGIQAIILAPSRELAIQIEQVFKSMKTGHKVNCCYGGHATKIERNNLLHAPALLIGTPGRVADHIRRHSIDTATIRTLVLDEFDKALEFGFQEDMAYIIGQLKNLKKRILTSATQALEIPDFTGISKPVTLNYLDNAKPLDLTIKAVKSEGTDKLEALFQLVCKIGNQATLVFCNHREAVERISGLLWDKGLAHDIFHGGMEQEDRERALIKFRNGSHHLLITTDLASRGLDIPEIKYIIHYQLPHQENAFIHRNGRTARMNAEGTAYLIVGEGEKFPTYLTEIPPFDDLPANPELPGFPEWTTLYIAGGKKDKINKVDIVGLLLQKGNLRKDELGLIDVQDFASYVAVKTDKIDETVRLLRDETIKKKKVKIAISK